MGPRNPLRVTGIQSPATTEEGSELTPFGLILPFLLLVQVSRLAKLLGQVSKDLMHFRLFYHLFTNQGLKAKLELT